MLAFSLTPIVLLLFSATAAPTALLPEISIPDTAGHNVEARADIAADSSCEAKADWALEEYKRVDKQCDDWGFKALFKGECYYAKPKNCCPEEKRSRGCKKFWPH